MGSVQEEVAAVGGWAAARQAGKREAVRVAAVVVTAPEGPERAAEEWRAVAREVRVTRVVVVQVREEEVGSVLETPGRAVKAAAVMPEAMLVEAVARVEGSVAADAGWAGVMLVKEVGEGSELVRARGIAAVQAVVWAVAATAVVAKVGAARAAVAVAERAVAARAAECVAAARAAAEVLEAAEEEAR